MKTAIVLLALSFSGIAACGSLPDASQVNDTSTATDTSTDARPYMPPSLTVSDPTELPPCTWQNIGQMAHVLDEHVLLSCANTSGGLQWSTMARDGGN